MARWGVTRSAVLGMALVALAALGACSGDDSDAATTSTERSTTTEATTTTTTAPERPASTTTTAYDPAAVEGQIEAAYLRSWDVYADAVYDLELDEAALAEVYADEHLQTKRDEITGRIEDGRAAHVRVDHDYTVQVLDETTAVVVDHYTNHQVLIDPESKEPIEEDPYELKSIVVSMRQVDGQWRVFRIEGL